MQWTKTGVSVGLMVAWAAVGWPAKAATVEGELAEMAGSWQGQVEGRSAALTLAAPAAGTLASTGTFALEGGPAHERYAFGVVRTEGRYYLLRGDLGATGSAAVESLPGGGLRIVRLARLPSENEVVVREEVLTIGRPRADGTRLLRVTLGERLCYDGVAPAPAACGPRESQEVLIKKLAP